MWALGLFLFGILEKTGLAEEKNFGFTADLTYASKYMTDGFKVGGDHSVFQPSIKWSLFSTGFSLFFWTALQTYRANQVNDELDFFVNYSHTFFSSRFFAMNWHGFYDYWVYPTRGTMDDWYGVTTELPTKQGNKLHAGVSLTELIPIARSHLVPSYNLYYWLYWAQNRTDAFQGGARHEIALHYYHSIPKVIPGTKEPYIGLSGFLNYNDGAFQVHPGLSHSIAQFTTGLRALGSMFSVSLHHQWSFEKSLNPLDETWSTFSLTRQF